MVRPEGCLTCPHHISGSVAALGPSGAQCLFYCTIYPSLTLAVLLKASHFLRRIGETAQMLKKGKEQFQRPLLVGALPFAFSESPFADFPHAWFKVCTLHSSFMPLS